ncbi:MAG: hypothetical protein HFH10_12700 [Dorea sp.]|nr:hypothetical protein [Dorea sp.]
MKHIIQDELWTEAVEGWADKRVTVYLSQNHEEYKELRERAENLCEKCPVIDPLIHGTGTIELTTEEHHIFTEYLEVKDRIEQLEREYHYYLGLATIPPFVSTIQLPQDKMGLSEEETGGRKNRLLDLLADGRMEGSDRVFQAADVKNKEGEERILELEKDLKESELPEEIRGKIDCYVSAVNAQWLRYSEFMYRYGIQDILALLRGV